MAEQQVDLISMADIGRLAGRSRATVGNWKSRKPDQFPPERGRGPRGPLYDRAEVIAWLDATGRLDKGQSDVAALWPVADRFRDTLPTEVVVPLLLVLLALRSKAPAAWERLRHLAAAEVDSALRAAVDEFLPDAREMIPPQRLPPAPAVDAIATLSRIEPTRDAALADAVLEQAAKMLGKRGGEYQAPASVRRLIVAIIEPSGIVYNPATGAGQLMVDLATATGSRPLKLVGQEISPHIRAICRLNLALHDVPAEIALGDVFTMDRYPQLRAERVVSMPPWNQRLPMVDRLRDDPRWIWGTPGQNDGNAAWIQHCLAHLADRGRGVVVLPSGALFEGGRAGRIRQRIVKAGLLDAVVALPAGLFVSTAVPCALLVFTKGRPDREGKPAPTLMVDLLASNDLPRRSVASLSDRVISDVATTYQQWTKGEDPDAGYAAVATYDDLAENEFVIDPRRYVSPPSITANLDIARRQRDELVQQLSSLTRTSHDADAQLQVVLESRQ